MFALVRRGPNFEPTASAGYKNRISFTALGKKLKTGQEAIFFFI